MHEHDRRVGQLLAELGQPLLQRGLGLFGRVEQVSDLAELRVESDRHDDADTTAGDDLRASVRHVGAVAERDVLGLDRIGVLVHRK